MDRPALPGSNNALVSGKELENLPSFGLSAYMNLASGAETLAMLENIKDGKYPNQKVNQMRQKGASSLTANPGPIKMPPPTTTSRSSDQVQVIIENSDEYENPNEYRFKFAAATKPVSSTIDETQIMETEVHNAESTGVAARPELKVKMMTSYMRFRYMSEKCPPKNKGGKTRHYDNEDTDKHCLAEVEVDNYTGVAKIVAYCVDSEGKLHPYNLFGEGCHQGVYVYKYKFRPGRKVRLQKVSVTTPKAKEYATNQKNQLAYLNQVGIQDIKFRAPESIHDKQIVYVMFKVILDDCDGEILSQISTPLQNKKKGKEFLIEDVEPVSCPAKMQPCYNQNKYRVMLHVTEGTAFPSEIGVKIRERDSTKKVVWEAEPTEIKTVKQCVVKFVPPAYRNPETKVDVEVEVYLYDKATKLETAPFKFVYKGSDNVRPEMNLESKAKKRKLNEDFDLSQYSFVPDNAVLGERKTLTALRSSSRPSSSSSGSSDGSSADNSLNYLEETQPEQVSASCMSGPFPQTQTSLTQGLNAGAEDRAVSLRKQNSANGQMPFSNYSGNGEYDQNVRQFDFGVSSSQTMDSSSRPLSAGFDREKSCTSQSTSFSQASLVTSTTSIFGGTAQTATYQTATMTAQPGSTSSMSYQTQQQLQQPQAAQRQESQVTLLTDKDKLFMTQSGYQLPKLAKNQMIALVGGQIFVVNDDTAEEASNTTALSNQSAAGYQQVLVQQMAPQQPASEAEQRQGSQPSNTAHGGLYQTQTMVNSTQAVGNPQYGATNSLNTTLALQSATLQQQGLLQQQIQQQLQQQLQQQQQQALLQQLTQIAADAGLDINTPGVYEGILQQINQLQTQAYLQQEAQTSNAGGAAMFPSGSDLNDDDDIEADGEQLSVTNKEDENSIIMEANQIPVFVNEVTIGDESNDSVSYTHVQSQKQADFKMKNGSFGNGIDSDDEEVS